MKHNPIYDVFIQSFANELDDDMETLSLYYGKDANKALAIYFDCEHKDKHILVSLDDGKTFNNLK